MKYLYENGSLTIYLEGRIDAENAATVLKELQVIRRGNPRGNMVLDMEKLNYISKEGLKVLMAMQKLEQNLSAVNVNSKIYELFDMTGLTFMIRVKKALQKLSLDGCQIIGQSARGVFYRLDEETIAKVYMAGISVEALEQERKYAQTALAYGVPTVTHYDIAQCGNQYAALYKLLNADTLSSAMHKNPDKMDEYIQMYAGQLKQLHTIEVKPGKLPNAKEMYQGKINAAAKYLIDEEQEKLQQLINSVPDKNTIIHGDFHPGNIMLQNDKLVFIGMEDLSMGHPIFDFLSMYLTHVMLPNHPEQLRQILGLSAEQMNQIWLGSLKNYFKSGAEAYLNNLQQQIRLFAGLKAVWCSTINSVYSPDNIEDALAKLRASILPEINTQTCALRF